MTHADIAARSIPASIAGRQASLARRLATAAAPALLAPAALVVFALAAPQAPRVALALHLGASSAAGHGFALGWLGALALDAADAAAGYAGAVALGALALYALAYLVYLRARERSGVVLSLCAALFALVTCFDAARVGGVAPAWLGAAVLLYVLDRAPRRGMWFAPLVAIVWCNASPTGLLAPVLTVLVALGRAADARDVTAARPYWPVAFASLAATLLTPAGLGFPAQALAALHLDLQFARLLPIAPATAAPHVFRIAATLVVIGAMWLWSGRRRAADAPLVLAALFLCFYDGAFVPLLGIVAAPAFAAAARNRYEATLAPGRADALAACLAGACVVAGALSAVPHAPTRSFGDASARALLESLPAGGTAHVVFCATIASCDYAETLPGMRPLLDERVEIAPAGTLDAQEKIARARAGWPATVREQHVDAMLVPRSIALAQLVPSLTGWKLAASDADTRLFVREGAAR